MEKKKKIGITSQNYEAPHAESVEVAQESILCASPSDIDGAPEKMTQVDGSWG